MDSRVVRDTPFDLCCLRLLLIDSIMLGTMLICMVILNGLIYLFGIGYAVWAYRGRRIAGVVLALAFLLFIFPILIFPLCFHAERAEERRQKRMPLVRWKVTAGWLLVVMSLMNSGLMTWFCRLARVEEVGDELAISCSLLATLFASILVVWMVRCAEREPESDY